MIKKLVKRLFGLLLVALAIAVGLAAYGWHWANSPVAINAPSTSFHIDAGKGARAVARTMQEAGVQVNDDLFVIMARLSQLDVQIKAGAYQAQVGDTPWQLLKRMADGDMIETRLTLVEGWTYQRIRQALRDDPGVRQTLEGVSDAQLLKRLGSDASSPEGLFYPDTYVFTPGTPDFDILQRAYDAQQQLLSTLWEQRSPNLPLKSPYEALILASIIEKETGHSEDRRRISGVFVNRLRKGMPLQTDPTVIYGLGDAYDGRLRRKQLEADTPWNTYTRAGLPPTPIASSGRAALEAALHPEPHDFLYFVSRGDGTSEFSENLRAHNRAVSKYIRGQ